MCIRWLVLLVPLLALGCSPNFDKLIINRTPDVPGSIIVTSTAFKNGQAIPDKYATTLDVSPPVEWSNVPAGAKSLVLLMEDADSPPPDPFVHWVIYNIPPTVSGLPENLPHLKKLKVPLGPIQGKNSRHREGYGHPTPPGDKVHHYHFEVYALDDVLPAESGYNKSQVITEMSGHVLAKGELIGTLK